MLCHRKLVLGLLGQKCLLPQRAGFCVLACVDVFLTLLVHVCYCSYVRKTCRGVTWFCSIYASSLLEISRIFIQSLGPLVVLGTRILEHSFFSGGQHLERTVLCFSPPPPVVPHLPYVLL